jgi:hypothetical protein
MIYDEPLITINTALGTWKFILLFVSIWSSNVSNGIDSLEKKTNISALKHNLPSFSLIFVESTPIKSLPQPQGCEDLELKTSNPPYRRP